MESVSCSIIRTISTSFTKINAKNQLLSSQLTPKNNNLHLLSFPTNFPRKLEKLGIFLPSSGFTTSGFTTFSAAPGQENKNTSSGLAILLEVDGVLIDANRQGTRQAFNVAFRKLGLDCANWTQPVYLDLLRKSAGDEERMLILFFNQIGWPTSLPTSEKGVFVKKALKEKEKALDELLMSKSLPLRPGIEDFMDEAHNEGVPVVVITSYSKCGDKSSRSIIEMLGSERVSIIKIVGNVEVEESMYGQLVLGKEKSFGLGGELAKEASKAASAEKQRIAEEVASMLNVKVDIDTTSPESLEKISAALRAGAEYAGVPVQNCVLIAGSKAGVNGAEQIAMPCVVMRSSLTSRAEFPSATAVMDGFGGADLTVSKLVQKLKS